MKNSMKVLFLLGIASSQFAITARGQLINFTFDENGNGFGPNGPLPYSTAYDVILGEFVLSYTLPFQVSPGDIALTEPGSTNISDVIRFGGVNHDQVWFYSVLDPGDPTPALADVPYMPNPHLAAAFLTESDLGGGNIGAIWTPAAATSYPGAGIYYDVHQYTIISDVPEPSTLAFVIIGGLVLTSGWRRHLARGTNVLTAH
jgi:hypothetical protein